MESINKETENSRDIFLKKVKTCEWSANMTVINLCNNNLVNSDFMEHFPANLIHLNLSFNEITEIPSEVLNLKYLVNLNISSNKIAYFDDTPKFCHTLEQLNLASNRLERPPYWIWAESPLNLKELDLSDNNCITKSLDDFYFEKLLSYRSLITELNMCNCRCKKYVQLLGTFPNVKKVVLGSPDSHRFNVNFLENVPCVGLDKCVDVERLNLTNTQLYSVLSSIDIYSNLLELDLSHNYIHSLPDEFCNLQNLQICILSFNNILYLPDHMSKLEKLTNLYLNNNELCMVPNNICRLPKLQILDIYNNNIYDLLEDIDNILAIDFALNYFDEPDDAAYLEKKSRLRKADSGRMDGKKIEVTKPESDYSSNRSEDYELDLSDSNKDYREQLRESSSSPEDWDSDDYWIPHHYPRKTPPPHSPWLYFVKQKMEEGNFCPMDMHTISVAEQVKYEKLCNPSVVYESEGQFDDYSEDDS